MITKLKTISLFPLFIIVYFFFWLLISLLGNIHPDSMDHWGWSKNLQWVYYEHPPMIAFLMKLTRVFISYNDFLVKLGGVVTASIVLTTAYITGRQFLNKTESFLYVIILHSSLYYSLYLSQFWFVDQAYNFFLLLCFFSIGKYFATKKKKWIILLGVFGGLGLFSKYIIVCFFISFVLWLICSDRHRSMLKKYYLWVSVIIGIIIISPIIYTDYNNNWNAISFIFNKGLKNSWSLQNIILFQIGHILAFSFFLSIPAWYFLIKKKFHSLLENNQTKFFFFQIIIPLLLFSYSSMRGRIADPNWINGVYIALYIFLARYFYICIAKKKKKYPIFLIVLSHIVIIGVTSFILLFQNYQFSFVNNTFASRLNESVGWKQITSKIKPLLSQKGETVPNYIISKHYSTGAAISFYLPNHPLYYTTQRPERKIVSISKVKFSRALVLIRTTVPEDLEKIQKIFPQKWEYMGNIEAVIRNRVIHSFQVWIKLPANKT